MNRQSQTIITSKRKFTIHLSKKSQSTFNYQYSKIQSKHIYTHLLFIHHTNRVWRTRRLPPPPTNGRGFFMPQMLNVLNSFRDRHIHTLISVLFIYIDDCIPKHALQSDPRYWNTFICHYIIFSVLPGP